MSRGVKTEAAGEEQVSPVAKIMEFAEKVKAGETFIGADGYYQDGYYAVAPYIEQAFGSHVRHQSRVYPKYDDNGSLSGLELLKRRLGRMYAALQDAPKIIRQEIENYENAIQNLKNQADEAATTAQQLAGLGLEGFLPAPAPEAEPADAAEA